MTAVLHPIGWSRIHGCSEPRRCCSSYSMDTGHSRKRTDPNTQSSACLFLGSHSSTLPYLSCTLSVFAFAVRCFR